MFSIPSLVVTVLMTWAPFLVSNFPRIASVRAAFDRRRLLTVNPSCALVCDLLPSLGTGARPERLGQATIKIFALDQKLPAPMSHGGNPEPRMSADIAAGPINVRFTPKSGHRNSAAKCLLCANGRHRRRQLAQRKTPASRRVSYLRG